MQSVERMLRLDDSQQWKVLIYDQPSRDIISPLLTVSKLRDIGVTLHMLLENPRESIPDVPAVYFMRPSQTNISRFVQDCKAQLYDSVYLNFSYPISPDLLSALARSLVEINAVNVVAKVFDQYLDFVALEPLLFSLNMGNSFERYNNPSVADTAIEQCMEDAARGACAMVCTLGMMPIIRAPLGGPAEMVARKLGELLHNLKDSMYFTQGVMEHRPMLLIVDRSIDMAAPLMHTSRYQTLVDDFLQFNLNRVKIKSKKEGEPPKVFSLDPEKDVFWAKNSKNLFHLTVEAQSHELKDVEKEEQKIKLQTGTDVSSMNGRSDGETSVLLNTVQSLPLLLERKKYLQMHLEILGGAMAVISKRQAHRFVQVEENLIFSQYAEKSAVMELLSDSTLELQDKIRLLCVYLLTAHPSKDESDEMEAAAIAGCSTSAFDQQCRAALGYVKRIMSLNRFGKDPVKEAAPTSLWDLASMTRGALENASRQVKNMVGASKVLPAVRMMQVACKDGNSESIAKEQDTQLLYIDPKVKGNVPPSARIRSAFQRGVLFVVGGGSYAEYHNLQDLATGSLNVSGDVLRLGSEGSNKDKSFMYGCTEVLNANKFIAQLATSQQ